MNQITISEIQIVPVKANNGLIAFASFLINNSLFVSSVAVYTRLDGRGKYRLVYPSKLVGSKEVNIFYPVTKEVGFEIEKEVTTAVQNILNKKSDEYVRHSNFNSTRK
jgi:stage V sporulation protein G